MSQTTQFPSSCDYWNSQMNHQLYQQFYSRMNLEQRLNPDMRYPYQEPNMIPPCQTQQHDPYKAESTAPYQYAQVKSETDEGKYGMNMYQISQNYLDNSMTPPPTTPSSVAASTTEINPRYAYESCRQYGYHMQPSPETDNYVLESPPKTPYSVGNDLKSPAPKEEYNDSPALRALLTRNEKKPNVPNYFIANPRKEVPVPQAYFEKADYFDGNFLDSPRNGFESSDVKTPPMIANEICDSERDVNAVSLPTENMVANNLLGYSPTQQQQRTEVNKMAAENASVFPWMKTSGAVDSYPSSEDINMNQSQMLLHTVANKFAEPRSEEISTMRTETNIPDDGIARPMTQFMHIPGPPCIT
ncbi:hypothetical protein CBL_05317 [Carabus blaptoides fortunei]